MRAASFAMGNGMISEASWQTGGVSRNGDAPYAQGPMDQQSVESLLRRLVERVEESERRYSEALDELHARLDRLSQTTGAARTTGSSEEAETFNRLHSQVSSLARRFEQDAASPLDDFERLGKALSGGLDYGSGGMDASSGATDPFGSTAYGSLQPEPPIASGPPFSFAMPETAYSAPPVMPPLPSEDRDLDKRLVEMAQRLEHSIGAAMPISAIEALNTRLDQIGHQLSQALEAAPKPNTLEPIERQLSELSQQLGRAEGQLARVSSIESQLLKLIERVDVTPSRLEEVASKAASEAARLAAGEIKSSTAERLDAMHRDLMAMNDRTRASDDRLASAIAAVHESLKQLVQQAEQGTPSSAPQSKPRSSFAERVRAEAEKPLPPQPQPAMAGQRPLADMRMEKGAAPQNGDSNGDGGAGAKDKSLRTRLGAAIPDFQETEMAPAFGRAKRGQSEEHAFDLDVPEPRRSFTETGFDAEYETPADLVAAARRAAQAAALRAEERPGGSRVRRVPSTPMTATSAGAEIPSRRKRSVLIICAAVLLVISAALLYGRLRSKPVAEVAPPPAAEQSAPAPSGSRHGTPSPGAEQSAPAPAEPKAETPAPATSGSSELQPEAEESPDENAASDAGETGNFTEVAKSPYRPASAMAGEGSAEPQLASLKPTGPAALPPRVVFTIEDPTRAPAPAAPAEPSSPLVPASLPMPPVELGSVALREAASGGDARAQYAIALRYAQGQGIPQNLNDAARWLERAASAGLAPAQYRLAAMYERGQGVSKDLGRARSWYQAAADKGNIKAMHNLAVGASGRGGGQADYVLAAKWYGEAAAYGLADSQFNLGILAEHGLGMTKTLTEAYKWFALAAASGDAEAAKRRELVKAQLDFAGLAAAEQAVKAWTVKQAEPEANEVLEAAEWAEAAAANPSLVTRAQALLNKLGYEVGAPDGQMGARTRDAIRSFERRNGLEETGKVTILLVTKLERLTS
jgi:localization factor PodJL